MKKLLFAVFILSSTQGFSQGLIRGIMGRLSFGLKGGVNYSDYTNAAFTTDALVGLHAGGLLNFRLTDHFSIEEEFLFSTQGAKVKGNVFGKEEVKISYMTVPLLLRYRTHSGFFIEAGPQVSMLVKDFSDPALSGNFAKKLDLGAAGGIGYQSPVGLGISARYVAGLSKVSDLSAAKVSPDFRNSVIQASIFYVF